MATSYICEHSVEFYLVPYIKSLLERDFKFVVPIFPWLSREFSKKSKRLHHDDSFYILVVFPRRPKLLDNSKIYVTVNEELENFEAVGAKHGVRVIAGCPLATDFWDLARCKEFSWIMIGHPKTDKYLIEAKPNTNYRSGNLLTDEQIIGFVKGSKLHNMESFEKFVRDARYDQPYSFFGGRYKPVYFLIREH